MDDYRDYMTDAERLLDKLGYKYTGLDEFEGNPVYCNKKLEDAKRGLVDGRKDQGIQWLLYFLVV